MDLQPPRIIIAGFGIPGRFIAELLDYHEVPYTVIETNAEVVHRCTTVRMIEGDVRDEKVLREAGIESADLLAITLPVESVVHQAIEVARRLRPDIRIAARVNYTSAGLTAQKLGADHVIVEVLLAAREFFRLIESDFIPKDHRVKDAARDPARLI
jgi:voltage-gated potassium channel Kch